MSSRLINEIRVTLIALTGINISVKLVHNNKLNEYLLWFDDLSLQESPQFTLATQGLHRHNIKVVMGSTSQPIITQIQNASYPQLSLAKDFIYLIEKNGFNIEHNIINSSQLYSITPNKLVFSSNKRKINNHTSDESILETAKSALAPIMAAVAELIGYEEAVESEKEISHYETEMEGQVNIQTVLTRERSQRNRQLCLGIHGEVCGICGFNPIEVYGDAGSIIEVHHKQPLGNLSNPELYDPKNDLIPLCPNCHRAVHTKRPVPWTPDQIKEKLTKE